MIKFKLQNIFAFGKSGPPNLGISKVKSADSKESEIRNESKVHRGTWILVSGKNLAFV